MNDKTSEDADELIVRNLHNKNSTRAKICILSALTKLFFNAQDLIDLLSNMDVRANDACDTSFLYKCGDLFPACLADVYDNPDEVRLNDFRLTIAEQRTANIFEFFSLR